jgi:glutamate formiminotransferase
VDGRTDLLECIPNVSEGHDQATLDALSDVVGGQAAVRLLDRTADPDHGRAVYTLAGLGLPLARAMEAFVETAIARIDMRHHVGRHPRIGAVDVAPFVPLGDTSMDRCIDQARLFAATIADRFGLPVYLYGRAAMGRDAPSLAELRRPGFEGLAEAMAKPGGAPDFGPSRPHPTAGATAVAARPYLIAFNIQLSAGDVSVARRLAHRLRERDGGLPAVQALGIELPSQGLVQLSLNLLDHERTPLWVVWEEARRLAAEEGVGVLDSELVGLAPTAALLAVADHIGTTSSDPLERRLAAAGSWLRIRGFDPSMALESRLAQAGGVGIAAG